MVSVARQHPHFILQYVASKKQCMQIMHLFACKRVLHAYTCIIYYNESVARYEQGSETLSNTRTINSEVNINCN